jgi:micrococcal nuclease
MKVKVILWAIIFVCCQQPQYSGKIHKVSDGDTFILQMHDGQLKVRLDGIDAPEGNQPFGKESKAFLSQFIGKGCRVEKKGNDRYGRILGVLWIEQVNVNVLMVRKGYAWHFKKYSKDKELADAEEIARAEKLGLWSKGDPIAPWEWRKK